MFLGKADTEENRAGFVATVPIGRGSTPADVANACTYLASDEANFITGVNLEVSLPDSHDALQVRTADKGLGGRWMAAGACEGIRLRF